MVAILDCVTEWRTPRDHSNSTPIRMQKEWIYRKCWTHQSNPTSVISNLKHLLSYVTKPGGHDSFLQMAYASTMSSEPSHFRSSSIRLYQTNYHRNVFHHSGGSTPICRVGDIQPKKYSFPLIVSCCEAKMLTITSRRFNIEIGIS